MSLKLDAAMMKYLYYLVLPAVLFININAVAMQKEDDPLKKTAKSLVKSSSSDFLIGEGWEVVDDGKKGVKTDASNIESMDYDKIPYSQLEDMGPISESTHCVTLECCCKPVISCVSYSTNLLWNFIPSTYDWEGLYKRLLCRKNNHEKQDDDS